MILCEEGDYQTCGVGGGDTRWSGKRWSPIAHTSSGLSTSGPSAPGNVKEVKEQEEGRKMGAREIHARGARLRRTLSIYDLAEHRNDRGVGGGWGRAYVMVWEDVAPSVHTSTGLSTSGPSAPRNVKEVKEQEEGRKMGEREIHARGARLRCTFSIYDLAGHRNDRGVGGGWGRAYVMVWEDVAPSVHTSTGLSTSGLTTRGWLSKGRAWIGPR